MAQLLYLNGFIVLPKMFQPSCIKLSRSVPLQKADGTHTGGDRRALYKYVTGEVKCKV